MYDSFKVAEAIKATARERGVLLRCMLGDLNMGINTLSQMSKGQIIGYDNLARIADYLNVSIDYLLGRSKAVQMGDTQLKFALFGDVDVDDEVLDEVKRMARIHKQMKDEKKREQGSK